MNDKTPLEYTLNDCRSTPNTLMYDAIKQFLLAQGFEEESLPNDTLITTMFTTFCATVAIRSGMPMDTSLKEVVMIWDKVMLNYATARVACDPSCLMKNDMTNAPVEDESIIIVPN